ncbi:cupin [[Pantoea] beijingensis]|uniref:Cupin n=1 Tax=[Pantoea] beijingensis TaxID=1324864 RepID=A0A443IEJ2_9GAMM|nr:cupin domain-containing protein [[Pantoea] beijingensis]RWR02483.1 cupin [[Pantoea] beijingensis]
MMNFRLTNVADAQVFRISPQDTNYFAVLFDKQQDDIDNIFVVEIFTVGGATPPNAHVHAHEFFYVLQGEGVASCNGNEVIIGKGDALLLHPGNEHLIRNTGNGKLYTLTVMTPNEGFAELIRSGEPMTLDEEDLRVLSGS